MIWIQLTSIQYEEKHGKQVTKYPGDWVQRSKQQAIRLINSNQAKSIDVNIISDSIDYTSGIVASSQPVDRIKQSIDAIPQLKLEIGTPKILFSETLIWDTSIILRPELLSVGFRLLETFQIVCPIYSYKTLAQDIGSDKEKQMTKEVIRDLRVPIKDCRLLFVRRCDDTEKVVAMWQEDVKNRHNSFLSFLRAVYKVKPLICDLPTTWVIR